MYPLTALHFQVSWGDSQNTSSFSEVSGLTTEVDVIEYRGGDDRSLTAQKQPGMVKPANVKLMRGISPKEAANGMFEWFDTIRAGSVQRRTVTISLLDEERNPVMIWKVQNAFPLKIEASTFKGSGNEIAFESIELANEGNVREVVA